MRSTWIAYARLKEAGATTGGRPYEAGIPTLPPRWDYKNWDAFYASLQILQTSSSGIKPAAT